MRPSRSANRKCRSATPPGKSWPSSVTTASGRQCETAVSASRASWATRAAVTSLRQLLRPGADELEVELRSVPAREVAAAAEVDLDTVTDWYAAAMSRLDAAVPPGHRSGPPGGRYDNELFTEGTGTVCVFRLFHDLRPARGVEVLELPAVELAVTVHHGPHDDIGVRYGRLGEWVVDHALAVDGPVHETYVAGPRDTDDPELWRTEIGWPIFRLAH